MRFIRVIGGIDMKLKNEMLINWAIENQYNIHNLNYNYSNSNYHLKNKNQVTKEVLITNY